MWRTVFVGWRQIKQVWKEAPIESGMLDYLKFVKIIKRGKDDD